MFGRRPSPSRDEVVAAAQRRLAALAGQRNSGSSLRAVHSPPRDAAPAGRPRETPVATTASDEGSSSQPAPRHLAETARDLSRPRVSAHHVTVAALLVLALVVAVAWWALRATPQSHPVELSSRRVPASTNAPGPPPGGPSSSYSTGVGAGGGPGTSPTGAARLVVDVAGKVRHPGIVELPAGSRVVDAIAAAGGARPGVSLTALNLARLLVDGEQIVVGVDVPGQTAVEPTASGGTTTVAPVNLNTATAEQLDALPDIGPVTAQAILQWRSEHGPFTSVEELVQVSGIGTATLADVRPYVYV